MGVDRFLRGLLQLGVVREVQVVVGTKHEHLSAIDYAVRRTVALERPKLPVQTGRFESQVLFAKEGKFVFWHIQNDPSRTSSENSMQQRHDG
jgi:hypothetical protein